MGDTEAARAAIVTTATVAADQRSATIEAARAAAQASTVARQGECQKRGPLCRDLGHVEQARMSELAAAIALPMPTAATIADPDPQVTATVRLARWVGLGVTATDVGNLRLALMALLPNIAGLAVLWDGVEAVGWPAGRGSELRFHHLSTLSTINPPSTATIRPTPTPTLQVFSRRGHSYRHLSTYRCQRSFSGTSFSSNQRKLRISQPAQLKSI
jgi:hypothetical protein